MVPPWIRRPRRAFYVALVVCQAGASPDPLLAQVGAPPAPAGAPLGSHLQISLMTIGPGDIYWERFGHNALVIRDERARTEIAYNWGMFDFNAEGFWPRLARGRMQY